MARTKTTHIGRPKKNKAEVNMIESIEKRNEQLAHAAESNKKDSEEMGGHYVHGNPLETINVMEFLADEWTKNGVPPRIICDLLQVIKYCSPRLGRKGGYESLEKDLLKIENYAHRARTGEWMESK